MGRGSGSLAPTMALITAICLLWVYPFCLFHQVSAVAYQRVTLSDFDHSSSHPLLCDGHQLYAALSGQETGAGAKAGISLRTEPLQAIPHERFSAVRRQEPTGPLLLAFRSAALSSSKELYVLNVVYQI
ncbi:hypothetical protein [Candidatus Methylomirabilis sp.]|uniref:hypothetical protein n=1 Tax=Candidatus Methylomirabilis sp. TaxID=2032687 RepID=UPI002A67A988|nr:hypothetical protein [Candidatus Methylomirabilis sp.]